jgi:hypothetical protein
MKQMYETQEDFMRMYPISAQGAELLMEFSQDFQPVIDPWERKFPQHLVSCLPWLTRDITGHTLPEPGQLLERPLAEETNPLYKVFSLDPEKGVTVEYFYVDKRSTPLISYVQNIELHILNTDGLVFLMDAIDECFADTEAIMLEEYLGRVYGDLVQTRIEQVRLPVSLEIANPNFGLSFSGYKTVDLFMEEGYDLPFNVLGVIDPESRVKEPIANLFKKPVE